MITKDYGKAILSCDVCGSTLNEEHETFQTLDEAIAAIEASGWTVQKGKTGIVDVCKECQKE
jgi:Fe2+ or Zn2+ uptake regulation protein